MGTLDICPDSRKFSTRRATVAGTCRDLHDCVYLWGRLQLAKEQNPPPEPQGGDGCQSNDPHVHQRGARAPSAIGKTATSSVVTIARRMTILL